MNTRKTVVASLLALALTHPPAATAQCPGDCNADAHVTIDELVAAVNAALTGCPADGSTAGGTCRPRGIITEPDVFLPSPGAATPINQTVLQINDAIYQASGFGNTFMVVTSEGNVIIDTSIFLTSAGHRDLLRAINAGPVRDIILTHAHSDHIGGVALWKEPATDVIAQRNQIEFLNYENRFRALFARRNLEQFSLLFGVKQLPPFAPPDAPVDNYGGQPVATTFFDEFTEFKLGGLTFQLMHTPGETPDHLTVWIPEYKIAFPGDNYYLSFPNLYTLRGTQPRQALDYVRSLDTVLGWKPEILAPSHGAPLYGRDHIQQVVGRYRDAILYVHDKTVQGLNAGKDVYTLMHEIELPPDLAQDEVYGNIPWSVRGIYEGYIGWFDGNVSNMYETPAAAIYPELVERAGGPDVLAGRAVELIEQGDPQRALHMADAALAADPNNVAALQAKRQAVQRLFDQAINLNERGWLNAARIELDARLHSTPE